MSRQLPETLGVACHYCSRFPDFFCLGRVLQVQVHEHLRMCIVRGPAVIFRELQFGPCRVSSTGSTMHLNTLPTVWTHAPKPFQRHSCGYLICCLGTVFYPAEVLSRVLPSSCELALWLPTMQAPTPLSQTRPWPLSSAGYSCKSLRTATTITDTLATCSGHLGQKRLLLRRPGELPRDISMLDPASVFLLLDDGRLSRREEHAVKQGG